MFFIDQAITNIETSFILGKRDPLHRKNGKKIFKRLLTFLLCMSRIIHSRYNHHLNTLLSQKLSKQFFKVHEKKIEKTLCYLGGFEQPVGHEKCCHHIIEYHFQLSENEFILNRSDGKPVVVWSSPYDKDHIYLQLWISFGRLRKNKPFLVLKNGVGLEAFGFYKQKENMYDVSEFYYDGGGCVKEVSQTNFYVNRIANYKNGFGHKDDGPNITSYYDDDFGICYREWKNNGKYHNFYGPAIRWGFLHYHYLWGYEVHPLLVPLKNFLFKRRDIDDGCHSISENEEIKMKKLFFEEIF